MNTIVKTTLMVMLTFLAIPVSAALVSDSLSVLNKTNQNGIDSQRKVDKLSLEEQAMLEEYRGLLHHIEYQDTYNQELRQLLVDQETEIAQLHEQLSQGQVTRMRIVPLMRSMSEALESFVVLDLPFHQNDRVAGMLQLNQRLRIPSLSIPDKFRLLLEAFQIENDYGYSIEAYRDNLQLDGETFSVDILRIGRIAIYYQTIDGKRSGYWDVEQRVWTPLPESENHQIMTALRVAKKQRAPQLLSLPMMPAEQLR
jgi:hypothetical protein